MLKLTNLELTIATLAVLTAIATPSSAVASYPKPKPQPNLLVSSSSNFNSQSDRYHHQPSELILTKKSGGRSGGGSFKSRPSRSQTSSPRPSTKSKKSTSPSGSYQSPTPKSHNYNRRDYDSPTYHRNYTSYPRRSSSTGGSLIGFLLLLIFLVGFVLVVFYIFRLLLNQGNTNSSSDRKIITERDNDRVTVSLLQVVLASGAENLQQDLTELSITVDTSTDEGLLKLLRESVLLLLRNDQYWTHVLASSQSWDVSQAESEFARLSLQERSKFTNESLSNVDGQLKTRETRNEDSNGFADYLVVTLLLGTADDNPLFERINTQESLDSALSKLSTLRGDYLLKLELLWTPQTANQYLTDEELLLEYTEVIPLA